MLTQDTIGQYVGTLGAGIFYRRLNGITTESRQIRVTARRAQVTGSSVYAQRQGGTAFLLAHATVQHGFTITPSSRVRLPPAFGPGQRREPPSRRQAGCPREEARRPRAHPPQLVNVAMG